MGSSGADGTAGTLSPTSSSVKRSGGKEALGVLSQSHVGRPVGEEWEAVAVVVLSLLKTDPSVESSSGLISTTFLSQGSGTGDAWVAARGTTTVGVEEVGERAVVTGARA